MSALYGEGSVRGVRWETGGTEYINLYVDASDFSSDLSVGAVGCIKHTQNGPEFAAVPNIDDGSVELAVFTGSSPAGSVAPYSGVGPKNATADGIYIFAVRGKCFALVDGNSVNVSAGDILEVLKNTDSFVKHAGADLGPEYHAVSAEAVTSDDNLTEVYLVGGRATPSAS